MKILVTGGAGYIGCVLVPKLLERGYDVTIIDTMWFGTKGIDDIKSKKFTVIKGDIRDKNTLDIATQKQDAVIHLAAISNDPCTELNHNLTYQVNYWATKELVEIAKRNGVTRFINASTSSVYGVKKEENVTEDLKLEPLTVYSKTKAMAEEFILNANDDNFTGVVLRPATACGYAPRMRLDLVVNILTAHAVNNRKIIVFGGEQKRPNIHVENIADIYVMLVELEKEKIAGQIFNAGYENHTVLTLANMVKQEIGNDIPIEIKESDDPRSYHISSEKLTRITGYRPKKTIQDAIRDMKQAFEDGRIIDWKDNKYYNIKTMKELGIHNEN